MLTSTEGFQCRASDMRETREDRQQRRQETQANRFAIEVLAPGYRTKRFLDDDPNLKTTQVMRDELDMSLEACVLSWGTSEPRPPPEPSPTLSDQVTFMDFGKLPRVDHVDFLSIAQRDVAKTECATQQILGRFHWGCCSCHLPHLWPP